MWKRTSREFHKGFGFALFTVGILAIVAYYLQSSVHNNKDILNFGIGEAVIGLLEMVVPIFVKKEG